MCLLSWQTCQVVHVHVCIYGQVRSFFYVGRHARLVSLLQKLRGTLNPETSLSLCKGASHPVLHQTECVHNQMDKVREQVPATHTCMCKWSHTFMQLVAKEKFMQLQKLVCRCVLVCFQCSKLCGQDLKKKYSTHHPLTLHTSSAMQ